ncbi:hypothetical protein D9611_014477 [Ephemerocybe angulata]|uniref:Uncharacterized protein n=1 Tax=Ephemerocybe angulata TaxID=980116 RepID=A0A8H5C3N0_9AGAR|nr:hypothetical protein D9611_014477 [Tulosesus angulatus]
MDVQTQRSPHHDVPGMEHAAQVQSGGTVGKDVRSGQRNKSRNRWKSIAKRVDCSCYDPKATDFTRASLVTTSSPPPPPAQNPNPPNVALPLAITTRNPRHPCDTQSPRTPPTSPNRPAHPQARKATSASPLSQAPAGPSPHNRSPHRTSNTTCSKRPSRFTLAVSRPGPCTGSSSSRAMCHKCRPAYTLYGGVVKGEYGGGELVAVPRP